jgi:hypothetical protein
MVVAQRQPGGDLLGVAAEALPDALSDRLEGLEAGATPRRVDPGALLGAVVDGDEDGGVTLVGEAAGGVAAPHLVRALGGDGAVVSLGAVGSTDAGRCQQASLAHQTQHPPLPGPDPRRAQPRPHLTVPLAEPGRAGDRLTNAFGQLRIAPLGLGTALLRRPRRGRLTGLDGVHRRAGDLQGAAAERQTIGPAGGGRDGLAHGLDLRGAKGEFASARRARSRSNSFSMVISPTLRRRRAISSSRSSEARLWRPTWPAAGTSAGHRDTSLLGASCPSRPRESWAGGTGPSAARTRSGALASRGQTDYARRRPRRAKRLELDQPIPEVETALPGFEWVRG